MTNDEKLAVIAGNLRAADEYMQKYTGYVSGAAFELASIALGSDSAEDALAVARLVIPADDRTVLAHFCRCYCRYAADVPEPVTELEFYGPENTVMIPEIARLEDVVGEFRMHGIELECLYGDSFSSCAESVEYGHSGYTLMPMTDPVDGRLRSFDRLRERFGLKIHRVLNTRGDDGGIYSYQLCALGFPDLSDESITRLSFAADVTCSPETYLEGVRVFGTSTLSAEIGYGDVSHVSAVLDVKGLCKKDISGLMMYLGRDADLTVDGYYAEIK